MPKGAELLKMIYTTMRQGRPRNDKEQKRKEKTKTRTVELWENMSLDIETTTAYMQPQTNVECLHRVTFHVFECGAMPFTRFVFWCVAACSAWPRLMLAIATDVTNIFCVSLTQMTRSIYLRYELCIEWPLIHKSVVCVWDAGVLVSAQMTQPSNIFIVLHITSFEG